MHIKEWEKKAANGVIEQIKKSIEKNGKLLDCWKYYLKNMSNHMLEVMKVLDKEFMNSIYEAQ